MDYKSSEFSLSNETLTKVKEGNEASLNHSKCIPFQSNKGFLLEGIFTKIECEAMLNNIKEIQAEKTRGYDKDHGMRTVNVSKELAEILQSRVESYLPKIIRRPPAAIINDQTDDIDWHYKCVSDKFKLISYEVGQNFPPHFDGGRNVDNQHMSLLSVLVYLNDGGAQSYTGGDFRFLKKNGPEQYSVLESVVPYAGHVIVFPHGTLHDSTAITNGVKYVIRTDIMYGV
ncbi:hypothetical protein SAMD00019534_121900 [Acytostelium subglobosum LB1]|uniref:hypothetical protein n=1 Tax=Acytostelium subglobosum LB1 TaxID=1410327 RepID=UPI0006449F9E|nr:hypothetical protein SAMD00019534_121900 [Acytostelium subglobosum LB1]GAM29014.1 hypothetical protein SAMD00019534_121900 [Acytostelium subglobosum LB1]|eukprot:XP_012748020.1 hypothetical protein SAMD00019534_121900 [Acytostelium subglobosum LB1]